MPGKEVIAGVIAGDERVPRDSDSLAFTAGDAIVSEPESARLRSTAMTRPDEKTGTIKKVGFLFVPILFALAAHLEFSWMGFTPTDDGWVLANSRRLLAGQIPHRDFLAIQPAGSVLLHVAEVAFGGDYTIWLSRLIVWLELVVIAWAWPDVLAKLTNTRFSRLHKTALAFLCFLFTSNTFSILAWPTIDGLFLVSIGLLLCLRAESYSKFLGYFLIGVSYLCKQNFAAVFPFVLIVLGDWKRVRYWTAAVLPGFLYVAFLAVFGAVPHALAQIGAQRGIVEHGIKPFLESRQVLSAIVAGLVFVALLTRKARRAQVLGITLGCLLLTGAALSLRTELYWYSSHTAMVLFGLVLGATLGLLVVKGASKEMAKAGILVSILAWATSISMGFNYPTLASGLMVLFLIWAILTTAGPELIRMKAFQVSAAVLVLACLVSYTVGRRRYIYRDRSAPELTAKLDGVLPGGRLIRTNRNTYEFLADLRLATQETGGARYAILPGISCYWVKANQLNPLPMDWPLAGAMPNPKMVDRYMADLAAQKGKIVLIVEKVAPESLRMGFLPLRENDYPAALMPYVRAHFNKIGETKFFELRQ